VTPSFAVWVQVVGFAVFGWLGVYLWTRRSRRTLLITVSVVGLFAQACFFIAGALSNSSPTLGQLRALERWFWWSSVVPVAAWFWAASLIRQSLRGTLGRWERWARTLAIGLACAIAGAGSASNLFLQFDQPRETASGGQTIGAGPWYWLFGAYVIALALAAAWTLALSARESAGQARTVRLQLWGLAGGAIFFLSGATLLALRFALPAPGVPLAGYGLLVAGLVVTGVGLARFGLLLDGQQVRRDLLFSFSELLILQTIYLGALAAVGALSTPELLALVALVTFTHGGLDRGRGILDQVFFSRAERHARAESRQFATALGTDPVISPRAATDPPEVVAPDEATGDQRPEAPPKAFKDAVRRGLSGLKNPPQLAQSPLLTEPFVGEHLAATAGEDNRLNRISALRAILIGQIEALRPPAEPAETTAEAARFYNVLYYPYVREYSRKAALSEARRLREERRRSGAAPSALEHVLEWLADIDEDTFYKWQRRASDMIAASLWEIAGGR
jgi:hypothetical protein